MNIWTFEFFSTFWSFLRKHKTNYFLKQWDTIFMTIFRIFTVFFCLRCLRCLMCSFTKERIRAVHWKLALFSAKKTNFQRLENHRWTVLIQHWYFPPTVEQHSSALICSRTSTLENVCKTCIFPFTVLFI